jgi:hypothetical protein
MRQGRQLHMHEEPLFRKREVHRVHKQPVLLFRRLAEKLFHKRAEHRVRKQPGQPFRKREVHMLPVLLFRRLAEKLFRKRAERKAHMQPVLPFHTHAEKPFRKPSLRHTVLPAHTDHRNELPVN